MNPEGLTLLKDLYSERELRRFDAIPIFKEKEFTRVAKEHHEVLENFSIQKSVKSLLGSDRNIQLTDFICQTLLPNVDRRAWGVCKPYCDYPDDKEFEDELQSCQVIIFLDNFDINEGGASMWIPNTHKIHRKPTVEQLSQPTFEAFGVEYPVKKRFVQAKRGDVAVYPGSLWQSCGLNKTDSSKRMLVATFIAGENKTQ